MTTSTVAQRPQSFASLIRKRDPGIGDTQLSVLKVLCEYGGWGPGFSWIWENRSTTQRICESLVKRGVATKVEPTDPRMLGRYSAVEWAQTYYNEGKVAEEAARRAWWATEAENGRIADLERKAVEAATQDLKSMYPDQFAHFLRLNRERLDAQS